MDSARPDNSRGAGDPEREAVLRAIVVQERDNPSTDYFVAPTLRRAGYEMVVRNHGSIPQTEELAGAAVVFVRYVPRAWQRAVQQVAPRLARVVLFMDDDVLDVRASAGMPLRYRLKLLRLAALRRSWLHRMGAELWVSTPYLQRKYAAWEPHLVAPVPVSLPDDVCRVFYHGTASHEAEIRWLRPIVEEVLRRDARIVFEVVGGKRVYRQYRGLSRVTVVHPMSWSAYRGFLAQPGRDIGLAPQLDSRFNQARSYTKFLDITNAGAVGIFASEGSCAGVIEHGRNGWLADMTHEAWIEAILTLAVDQQRRRAMHDGALGTVRAM